MNKVNKVEGDDESLDIQTNDYKIAHLPKEEALNILKQAESSLAELTGREVTLIAYEKHEDAEIVNPT